MLAILLFIVGQWLIKILKAAFKKQINKKQYPTTIRSFLHNLVFTVLQVLLLLLVLQILGLQLTMFAALVAAFGAAAGLALSGVLQNFTSGIIILVMKPFKVGDSIVAQGEQGIVSAIQLFHTIVITFDNRTLILPNSKVSNDVIVNISLQGNRRLDIELKFKFEYDIAAVKKAILDIIASIPEIHKEPAPRVGVSSLERMGLR